MLICSMCFVFRHVEMLKALFLLGMLICSKCLLDMLRCSKCFVFVEIVKVISRHIEMSKLFCLDMMRCSTSFLDMLRYSRYFV